MRLKLEETISLVNTVFNTVLTWEELRELYSLDSLIKYVKQAYEEIIDEVSLSAYEDILSDLELSSGSIIINPNDDQYLLLFEHMLSLL